MTPSPDYDVLEGLAKAATPGEWGVEDPMDHCLSIIANPADPVYDWKWVATCDWPDEDDHLVTSREVKANAAFIAAANPTTILALIAKARAGEAAVEASEIVQQFVTRIMMERRCNNLGPNVAEPIMTRAQAFLAALQDQPQ